MYNHFREMVSVAYIEIKQWNEYYASLTFCSIIFKKFKQFKYKTTQFSSIWFLINFVRLTPILERKSYFWHMVAIKTKAGNFEPIRRPCY